MSVLQVLAAITIQCRRRRIPQTARRTQSIQDSGIVSRGCSCKCTSSARVSASQLNFWRITIRVAAMNMLNRRSERTHTCRSTWFTSNGLEHVSALDRTHTFIPSWKSRITVIICGGTPETGGHLPQYILIDRIVGLLDVDEAEEERYPCLPS